MVKLGRRGVLGGLLGLVAAKPVAAALAPVPATVALSPVPSTRVQQVVELLEHPAGPLITKEEAKLMLDFPDLDKVVVPLDDAYEVRFCQYYDDMPRGGIVPFKLPRDRVSKG